MKIECMIAIPGFPITDLERLNSAQCIVGTPGCVDDLITQKTLPVHAIKLFVLDEIDNMLDRGFKEHICNIHQNLPVKCQLNVILRSTLAINEIETVLGFKHDPVRIMQKREVINLQHIKHFYIDVEQEARKLETLCDLYEHCIMNTKTIIRCNTRRKVKWLTENMHERGFTLVMSMHDEMSRQQQKLNWNTFRTESSCVLIMHVLFPLHGIELRSPLVINYDLPTNCENYLYRVGQVDQYSSNRVIINFSTSDSNSALHHIELFYKIDMQEMPMIVADYLCERQ